MILFFIIFLFFSKITPSFLTVKEGSTSPLGLLPSGKKRETALLGARNRFALRLADQSGLRHDVRDGTAGGGIGPHGDRFQQWFDWLCGKGA